MLVDDGVECQPITPGSCEVTDIDIVIASCLHLTPQKQCILSGFCLFVVCLFDGDVLDLETIKTNISERPDR